MTQPPYQHDPYQQDPYQQDPYQSGGYGQGGYDYNGYQPVPYQQPYPYAPVARPPMSGFAITSLVLGILALLFCWIPFVGVIAWPLLLVGGGLGIVALGPTRRGEADGHGLAIAGVVCSGVALLVCLVYLFLAFAVFAG